MSSSKEVVILVIMSFLLVGLVSIHLVFAVPVKKGPISCTPHPNTLGPSGDSVSAIVCCQTTTDSEGIEVNTCTICDDTNPPSNCTKPFTQRTSSGSITGSQPNQIGNAPQSSTPPPLNAPPPASPLTSQTICPDGSLPDANGNCPSSTTTTTNNQQLTPPTSSTQHHHKGSNLLGGQEATKRGSNKNDNSPTPPPCPTDNSPIPPNCTLKPKF